MRKIDHKFSAKYNLQDDLYKYDSSSSIANPFFAITLGNVD